MRLRFLLFLLVVLIPAGASSQQRPSGAVVNLSEGASATGQTSGVVPSGPCQEERSLTCPGPVSLLQPRPMAAPQRFVIKVFLYGIEPQLWRRFSIPAEATFAELHGALQQAIGWEGQRTRDRIARGVEGQNKA